MPGTLGIQFGCIGCGSMNPIGAETCSGCGHRFAGPDIVSTFVSPERSREPPGAPTARGSRFRIGTAMVFIAVTAVCLRAWVAHYALGVVATLVLLPASIRTFLVASRREAEGRPMTLGEQAATFWSTIWAVVRVVIASAWTFGAVCMIGTPSNIRVVLVVAAVAATGVAFLVIRDLLSRARARERRDQIRSR